MILPVATLSLLSALTVAPVPEMTQPSPSPSVSVANILPVDTPFVGLISTKGKTWATLNRFYLFQTASKAVSQFLPPLFELDYSRDIESWLGEQVALVFLPKVGSATVSIDSQFLILAPVKDDTRLQPLLEKFKEDKSRVKEREYKGITILEIETPEIAPPTTTLPSSVRRLKSASAPNTVKPDLSQKKRGIAIATLPGYVVTGITAKAIEQLIDTSQASTTLGENPQFQETFQQSQSDGVLFTIYENIDTLIPLIGDISKDPSLPFPVLGADSIDLEAAKEYGNVNGFVTIQPEGLRLQVSAYRQALKSKQSKITKKTGTMLDRMPGATYSAVTGRNLNQQWQQLAKGFSTKPQLKEYLEMFRNGIRTTTGLDWDKDILGWMDGEYGFFLFPTKGGLFKFVAGSNFNMGMGVAVQTSNRSAADATFKKLDELIQSFLMGGVVVNTHNIQGQSVTSWDLGGDSSQSLLAYSWVDDNTVILTTGFGAIADLVPEPYILLPSTYNFQTATNSLPSPNHGYFYLNTGSFLSWLYGFLPSVFNNETFQPWKQVIGSVYSISATTSTTTEREQFDVLLVLAPSRKE